MSKELHGLHQLRVELERELHGHREAIELRNRDLDDMVNRLQHAEDYIRHIESSPSKLHELESKLALASTELERLNRQLKEAQGEALTKTGQFRETSNLLAHYQQENEQLRN
jgi:peptidoglycan hydrolase CwlO-like protein